MKLKLKQIGKEKNWIWGWYENTPQVSGLFVGGVCRQLFHAICSLAMTFRKAKRIEYKRKQQKHDYDNRKAYSTTLSIY